MRKFLSFLFSLFFIISIASAQNASSSFEKECRLAGGGGFANGFSGARGGPDVWLQMSYRLSKGFSVATEFENMYYKRTGYFQSVSVGGVNVRKMYDNYASFLIKYHLPIQSKLQISAVSGWSYRILQEIYDYEQTTSTGQHYTASSRTHYSNYGIPLIAEAYYPLSKIFQIGIRGRYNLNTDNDATYSAGLALSIKL